MINRAIPTNEEKMMREDDFIVSKTDIKGRIIYGNRIFIEFSGYTEAELLGAQHNIIRHPDMPRGIFKLLWNTIQAGKECFAYVKNMTKDGAFYWVFAYVTPSFDVSGNIIGYLSIRRKPNSHAVKAISDIYRSMLMEEHRAGALNACNASLNLLNQRLADKNMTYEEFIFTL
jgi:PAS domain S-box-containing protein